MRRAGEAKRHAGRIDEGLAILETTIDQYGVRFYRNRWLAIAAGVWERLRLAIRGLGVRVRPRTMIPEQELRRVQGLAAISYSYASLDFGFGLALQTRAIRAALDLGDVEESLGALGLESVFRGITGSARASERAEASIARIASHRHVAAEYVTAIGALCRNLASGDAKTSASLAQKIVNSIDAWPRPDWRKSGTWTPVGVSLFDSLNVASWNPILRFVERRDELAGPFAEIRAKTYVLLTLYLRLGDVRSARRWTSETTWSTISRRPLFARAVAAVFDSWAILYDGNSHVALARAREAVGLSRASLASRTNILRTQLALRLASAGLAVGDRSSIEYALTLLPARRSHRLLSRYRLHIEALLALHDRRDERASLAHLAEFGKAHAFELPEACARWALGRLDQGPAGGVHRARYLEMIEGTGIVDPDRFMWSCAPVGEPPVRTMTERSAWHT